MLEFHIIDSVEKLNFIWYFSKFSHFIWMSTLKFYNNKIVRYIWNEFSFIRKSIWISNDIHQRIFVHSISEIQNWHSETLNNRIKFQKFENYLKFRTKFSRIKSVFKNLMRYYEFKYHHLNFKWFSVGRNCFFLNIYQECLKFDSIVSNSEYDSSELNK